MIDPEVVDDVTLFRIEELHSSLLKPTSSISDSPFRQVLPFCPEHIQPYESVSRIPEPGVKDHLLKLSQLPDIVACAITVGPKMNDKEALTFWGQAFVNLLL